MLLFMILVPHQHDVIGAGHVKHDCELLSRLYHSCVRDELTVVIWG